MILFRSRPLATWGVIVLTSAFTLLPAHVAQSQSDRGRGGGSGGSGSSQPSLESRVGALEAVITALQNAVASQGEQVAQLQGLLASQANLIASLSTTLDDQANAIASLTATVAQQADKLTELQNRAASQADQIAALAQSAAAYTDEQISHEAAAREAGDASALTAAKSYADQKNGETLAAAQTYAQDQVAPVADKLVHVSRRGDDLFITGANLHILNGLGNTDSTNGLGNLVIGYNETRGDGDDRTGSHNLVVGQQQNFSSFGGFVAGFDNNILGPYASVTGGTGNTASGRGSWIGGGQDHTASGPSDAVSGGQNSAVGGESNPASDGTENSPTVVSSVFDRLLFALRP
jgi:trimeric autotransporter adhesin